MPDITDDQKRSEIYKAMGMNKYAGGGFIPPQPETGPNLGMPDQNDPSFWEQVKNSLSKLSNSPAGMAAKAITEPVNTMAGIVSSVAPTVLEKGLPPISKAINALSGGATPVVDAPPPAQAPAAGAPELQTPPPPPPAASPVQSPVTKAPSAMPDAGLNAALNPDVSKITEGYNAEDRKKLAGDIGAGQGGVGSILAQALAGFGDAISAKGGREQHALKDIFGLQKQRRDEAMANFDKERSARTEQIDLKAKMVTNEIQKLAAQDAYGVDEHLNKQLGAPPGTKHKDLPLYMQLMTSKAAQSDKDTELYMKAHKQAADEIEGAAKSSSMFSFKPSPAQMQAQGAKLADQYYNRAKGNVLFQPSDGQKALWIPAKRLSEAQQMDPHGKVVQ